MDATAESRVRRLADALTAVRIPLVPLFEYADDLEKHFADPDTIEVSCIAALVRARAATARREITRYLEALEEAATRVAGAPEYSGTARHVPD